MERNYMEISHDLVLCRIICGKKGFRGARSLLNAVWKQYLNLIKRWGLE